jgi:hypothetical protein
MLPGDALGVPAVGRTAPTSGTAALGDPRQQALQRALAPFLGKSMQGDVLARLADGSAVVRVADTVARMPLPGSAQAGAQVPLTLLALHPRPTFQVGTPGQPALAYVEAGPPLAEGADPHAAPLALREGAAAAAARTALSARLPFGAAGAGADLSPAGRALGGVLAAALKNEHPASAVAGSAPVLGAPGADPAALAGALARTVATSGLFYESHVAEWAGGARSLAELGAEPQQAAASAGRPPDPTDPATAGFINLQLVAHEQDHIAWQGQLWPGQPLRLEIDKDAPEGGAAADGGADAAWQSRLRLRFPQLGELDATLALAGNRLQLRVAAGSNGARDLLRAHQGQLVDAMAAAGTPLAALSIQLTRGADE